MEEILLTIGRRQVDAMFKATARDPVDDELFVPMLASLVGCFRHQKVPKSVADQIWDYAIEAYDRLCQEVEPETTYEQNKALMLSFL